MLLKNLKYVAPDFHIAEAPLGVANGRFVPLDAAGEDTLDCEGLSALPGFIDIHTHGGDDIDPADCDVADLLTLTLYYAHHGVTAYCPTSMTLPQDALLKMAETAEAAKGKEPGAAILGIHLEGPFVSPEKCGAQNPAYLRLPDVEEFRRVNAVSPVRLVSLAPELPGALAFARAVKETAVCSVAHTGATFEEAQAAFRSGFSHVTHFFNAMTPLHHRAPGVVGAVLADDAVTAELICDGFHLAPETVRLAFKLLGRDRPVVVSDSLRCAGCPDGDFQLGGQRVLLRGGEARLADGTIAGSTTNLFDEFKNLLSFGVPLASALAACSRNPARAIGVFDQRGSIEPGKAADLLFVDHEMNLRHVMAGGRMVF